MITLTPQQPIQVVPNGDGYAMVDQSCGPQIAAGISALAQAAAASAAQAEAQMASFVASEDAATDTIVSNPNSATSKTLADLYDQSGSAAAIGIAVQASQTRQGVVIPPTVTIADLQTAINSATTFGAMVQLSGTITTSQTLTITCSCDLSNLTINYTGTGTCVEVGTQSGITAHMIFRLPRVINANKTQLGWSQVTGSVGIDLVNLQSCPVVTIPYVNNFAVGVQSRGYGMGHVYNAITIGQLDNNEVNLYITANSTGWSNQNNYISGRLDHSSSEGSAVTGAAHLYIQDGLSNPADNNTFTNLSLEGDVPQWHAYIGGTCNVLVNCRYEDDSNPPRVCWGTSATRNTILYGYMAANITFTFNTGASSNHVITGANWQISGGGSAPLLQFENVGSSAYPALAIMGAGATASGVNPSTGYAWAMASTVLQGKRPTDANPRIAVSAQNGSVLVGNGAAAPVNGLNGPYGTTGTFWVGHMAPVTTASYDIGAAAYEWRNGYFSGVVQPGSGATSARPTTTAVGGMWFDTTLGIPIWWNGSKWVNASGTAV